MIDSIDHQSINQFNKIWQLEGWITRQYKNINIHLHTISMQKQSLIVLSA